MLDLFRSRTIGVMQAQLAALDRSLAVIEFTMDGKVLTANANFLKLMGYSLAEIQGREHTLFVDPRERSSAAYRDFWAKLGRGEYHSGEFKRIAKGGREVWIEGTYNPVLDPDGRPVKVVKYAADITAQKMEFANLLGQVNAITRSQAVIEFGLDGTVLTANENFLKLMGYTLQEIVGRPHAQFVEAAARDSEEYRTFWQTLRSGRFLNGQYKRIAKGGREVWIEGSYNPVLDLNGKPCKIVKFATDITAQMELLGNLKTLIDRNFGEIDSALDVSERQAGRASEAAGDTLANVQMVASSAEELAASIREISQNMQRSRDATDQAVERAGAADQATQRLTDAATAMTGIVDLIRTIAGQINLLALNATIEAARAGEAGRGFAVVATEVKNLANQAAQATSQITREIEGVQSVSGEVVGTLREIREAIGMVREHVAGTASAIEEQSAVTRDMSQTMQTTAQDVGSATRSLGEIGAALQQVGQAIARTKEAAQVLAR
ncbi:methyl-accepting chemotaxis protein [Rhodospirillum centenum]|uniref:Methyl-accepting chemotaxis protein, putative n=1 Tax=Rhodospirillum centenum (strain ATCC 51521 / SW) TaxID=414684 RepID=B6IQN9_RHOCS|nr:PAS domain-containing methyl-accepting chemotaxis protein [Rhodospirillum centenum]ACI97775.1 methyl-accepting chemotaxis protein, putative [Rhodospirillum centenum SW]